MKSFQYIIFTCTITITLLFVSFCSMVGYTYEGAENNPIYMILCVLFGGESILYILKRKEKKGNSTVFFLIALSILLFVIGYLSDLGGSNGFRDLNKNYMVFLEYAVPSMFIGNYVSRKKLLPDLSRYLDIVMLIMSIGLIRAIPGMKEGILGIGGDTYQATSYIAGFSFGLNIFGLIEGNRYNRFGFCNSKIYRIVCIFLLFIQLIVAILSGGRGGVLLCLVNMALALIASKKISYLVAGVFVALLFSIILPRFLSSEALGDIFESGFERAFSYIVDGGIDMSETSNRDGVYQYYWQRIKEEPILGYGVFRNEPGHPHNFFLDILYQGGLIYLLFWFYIFAQFFNKLLKIRRSHNDALLLPLATYPLTMLLFSGTYLHTPLFWFSLFYVMNYPIINNKKCSKNESSNSV